MRNFITGLLVVLAPVVCGAQTWTTPGTQAVPVVDVVHGMQLTDPYRWLEDKLNPATQQWTRQQHDATLRWLDANAPTPAGLRNDLERFVDRTITSAPTYYRGQAFFTRKAKGEAQAKLFTQINDRETMLFDPVALDPSSKTSISSFSMSPHDTLLLVAVQRAGSEITDTHFIDRVTGTAQFAPFIGVASASWAATPRVIYFTKRTRALINAQTPLHVYRAQLGTPLDLAQRVVENDDAKNWVGVEEPERSRYTLTTRGDFNSRTYTVSPLGSLSSTQTLFSSKSARANIELVGDIAYIHSNENASNWKLERVASLSRGAMVRTPLISERPDVQLAGFAVTNTHIIAREKRNLSHELRVYGLDGSPATELSTLRPPELGDVTSVRFDHHDNSLYVALSTFNTPSTLYRVNAATFEWTRVFQDESAIDTSKIETTRIDIPTRDGKRVPAFVSMRRGTPLNGDQPVLLYGYGGFNIGIGMRYLGAMSALINRGVIFVETGIRGGNELGEAWHQDGMLANKHNSFNDFIDSAQWLIDQGYTNPKRLAIYGGSNGGLLVGAVATQRPDLFKAVVCSVPLLDMIRYDQFLIARYWIPEYGDPSKSTDFRKLLSYSPYHHIRSGVELPTMLVIAGENDTRVDPLHAKKFVARAQNNPGQTKPVMLKMDFDSGHGSGKSTQQLIDDREVWMRFVLGQIAQ